MGLKVSISVVDVSAVVTGVVDINGVGVELSVDGANVVVGVSGAEGVVLLVGVVEINVVELSGDVDVVGPMVTVLLVDDDGVVDSGFSVALVVLVSEVVVGELVSTICGRFTRCLTCCAGVAACRLCCSCCDCCLSCGCGCG